MNSVCLFICFFVCVFVCSRDGVNTRTVYSNTNTNTSYLYEYEYTEILIIGIQIRILHESIGECIHEYFSLKVTFSCRQLGIEPNMVLKLFNSKMTS